MPCLQSLPSRYSWHFSYLTPHFCLGHSLHCNVFLKYLESLSFCFPSAIERCFEGSFLFFKKILSQGFPLFFSFCWLATQGKGNVSKPLLVCYITWKQWARYGFWMCFTTTRTWKNDLFELKWPEIPRQCDHWPCWVGVSGSYIPESQFFHILTEAKSLECLLLPAPLDDRRSGLGVLLNKNKTNSK